jgi:hypothetical protein
MSLEVVVVESVRQFGALVVASVAAVASVRAASLSTSTRRQLRPTNGDDRTTRAVLEAMNEALHANGKRLDSQGREIGALEAGQTAQNEAIDVLVDAIGNHQTFCAQNIDLFHGIVQPGGRRKSDPPKGETSP